ncbi:MAG: methyltransferase domain-containing protein [Proteobacteria bacterium]|nr:methyltransferase domain-containing protein [Pseudomonadota bacterium]
MRRLLPELRRVHTDGDVTDYVVREVRGRRVLDIGVVSHAAHYFESPGWRHGRIHRAADYCVGIDIIAPLVDELNGRGFNVRCIDATSDADLGERFDVVFIGDVIEHVANPGALLGFAARHLQPDGRLLVATPNPYSRAFYRSFRREGIIVVNLDHVAWFTPTMAYELARRSGLKMIAYHLNKPLSGWRLAWKRLLWRMNWSPVEFSFSDHLFEFALPG